MKIKRITANLNDQEVRTLEKIKNHFDKKHINLSDSDILTWALTTAYELLKDNIYHD